MSCTSKVRARKSNFWGVLLWNWVI